MGDDGVGDKTLLMLAAIGDEARRDRFLDELRERTDGSRSVALECGHFMQAQKPDEVAAELTSFFEGRRTRSFHIPHEAEEASPEPDAARGEL